jgi:dihydropyrimidinase
MFTWAPDNGVALPTLVRAMSETPARLFGLAARKGTLLPGADADILLVDPTARRIVQADEVWPTVCPNPLAGECLGGWPEMTIRRGAIAFDGKTVVASPGSGELIPQLEGAR